MKITKKLKSTISGLALVLASLSSISTCTANEIYKVRSIKYIDKLTINTSTEFRTAVKQSEERGIGQIRTLIGNSDLEEEWVFIPRDSLWVEVGINEKLKLNNGNPEGSVEYEDLGLEDLLREDKEFTIYHFHPSLRRQRDDKIEKELCSRFSKENEAYFKCQNYKDLVITEYLAEDVLPSIQDIVNMVNNSKLNREVNGEEIKFKIGSTAGVSEYSLSEQGLDCFKNLDKNSIREYASNRVKIAIDSYSRLDLNDPSNVDMVNRAEQLVKLINDDKLIVKFTPYKN